MRYSVPHNEHREVVERVPKFLAEIEMEQPAAGRYAEVAESEASLERFETSLTATGDREYFETAGGAEPC
jgi:hypothetical protein